LSGLRSSWLMLERNSDLARLAFSATAIARCSSAFLFCRALSTNLRAAASLSLRNSCSRMLRFSSWKCLRRNWARSRALSTPKSADLAM